MTVWSSRLLFDYDTPLSYPCLGRPCNLVDPRELTRRLLSIGRSWTDWARWWVSQLTGVLASMQLVSVPCHPPGATCVLTWVQTVCKLCETLCKICKLPSASVPPPHPLEGDVVGHPCESIHPIMISNSDSQRLRFIILEDIIGHTLASWVLRPGNQKVNGQRIEGPESEWNLSTLVPVYKMFTTMCSCVQDVYNCVQAGAGQHWLLWSKYLFVHKQYVCRQYFPTRVQTR